MACNLKSIASGSAGRSAMARRFSALTSWIWSEDAIRPVIACWSSARSGSSFSKRSAQMLAADLKSLRSGADQESVQLLPGFDPYLMGHATRDHLFDPVHRWKVSRVAGWISPVVLVNGRVMGVWTHAVTKGGLKVDLTPFAPLKPRVIKEAGARVEIIATALGANLDRVTVA